MNKTLLINNCIDQYIEKTFKDNSNLKQFFKKHERRPALVKGISKCIKELEKKNLKFFNNNDLFNLIDNLTHQFCKLAINHAEQNNKKSNSKFIYDQFGNRKNITLDKEPELPEGVIEVERNLSNQQNTKYQT